MSRTTFDHLLNTPAWREYRQRHNWPNKELELDSLQPQIVFSRSMPLVGPVHVIAACEQKLTLKSVDKFTTKIQQALSGSVVKVWFTQAYDETIIDKLKENGWQSARHPVSTPSELKIDLSQGAESLYESFDKKTRYKLRKAQREGVEVSVSDGDPEDIDVLAKLVAITKERTDSGVRPMSQMHEAWDLFKQYDSLRIWKATYEGKVLNAIAVVLTDDTVWNRDSGSLRGYNKLSAPTYLRWKVAEYYADEGQRSTYNLMGVTPKKFRDNNQPHTLDGVTQFKQIYNPEISDSIGVFELPLDGKAHRRLQKIEPWMLRLSNRVRGEYWY